MFMHAQDDAPDPAPLGIVDGAGRGVIRQRRFAHMIRRLSKNDTALALHGHNETACGTNDLPGDPG
jgi:hypothetical protein